MPQSESVAIFWDYETCPPSSTLNGYEITSNIRSLAHNFGSVTSFKAYLELTSPGASPTLLNLRPELHASGVSLTYCPSNGRKGVSGTMMIVDIMAYAADHPLTTILIISGNRDYAYVVSILRLRRCRVVVVCPPTSHPSLMSQASVHLDWNTEVLGQRPSDPPAESNIPDPRPQLLRSRQRGNSTSSAAFPPTPTSRAAQDDEDITDDDDLFSPRRAATYSGGSFNSTHPNGIAGAHSSSRYTDSLPERHSPGRHSWAPSKVHPPPTSFLSAKTSPPLAEKPAESRSTPHHNRVLYDGSPTSNLDLPKGFPIHEPEPITLKGHAPVAENPGQAPPWLTRNLSQVSLGVSKHLDAPSTTSFVIPVTSPAVLPPTLPPLSRSPSSYATPATNTAPTPAPPIPVQATIPISPKPPSITGSPAPAPPAAVKATIPPASSTPVSAPVVPKQTSQTSLPSIPPSQTMSAASQPPPAPAVPKPAPPPLTVASSSAAGSSTGAQPTKAAPAHFRVLVDVLEARRRSNGQIRIPRTEVGADLAKHKTAYKQAGVTKFSAYIDLAEAASIVDLGGTGNTQWVMLRPEWSAPPL